MKGYENMVKDFWYSYSYILIFLILPQKIATIRNLSDVVWLSSLLDDVIVL